ncbi:acyl-homoserine-lactone synthase [Rugamonas rubra]|uniref:Acyl-homoserine-lactone synthase n=1 Tax=Rugamonas rubra TaxID=758825 RepID=A0A1I4K7W2_9BURK|nr:acyl-homoserine-lactone synthase [Rugamonas rubra]SFL74875.1 N-acyl-L-homoserine lactone synthetase [Rugamonas rubra]
MNVISGKAETLSAALMADMASYRYKVFIETLGWELETRNRQEVDQFDHDDTLYVVSKDEAGHINGCARLLPTSSPYLLGEVFPQLMNGAPVPCSPDVWELSRFAAVDFEQQASSALDQFSAGFSIQLLHQAIACAKAHGARRLITVSPIGIERLLRRGGIHAHRAGPPMIVGGHPIFACWIELGDEAGA